MYVKSDMNKSRAGQQTGRLPGSKLTKVSKSIRYPRDVARVLGAGTWVLQGPRGALDSPSPWLQWTRVSYSQSEGRIATAFKVTALLTITVYALICVQAIVTTSVQYKSAPDCDDADIEDSGLTHGNAPAKFHVPFDILDFSGGPTGDSIEFSILEEVDTTDLNVPRDCHVTSTDFRNVDVDIGEPSWITVQYSGVYAFSAHLAQNGTVRVVGYIVRGVYNPRLYCNLWNAHESRLTSHSARVVRLTQGDVNDETNRFDVAVFECKSDKNLTATPVLLSITTEPCERSRSYLTPTRTGLLATSHTCVISANTSTPGADDIRNLVEGLLVHPGSDRITVYDGNAHAQKNIEQYRNNVTYIRSVLPRVVDKFVDSWSHVKFIVSDCVLAGAQENTNLVVVLPDTNVKEAHRSICQFMSNNIMKVSKLIIHSNTTIMTKACD